MSNTVVAMLEVTKLWWSYVVWNNAITAGVDG